MVFKKSVTKFNFEDNYSVFTVNKLTDDKDVIKTVLATSSHLEGMLSEGDAPLSLLDGSHGNNESKLIMVLLVKLFQALQQVHNINAVLI